MRFSPKTSTPRGLRYVASFFGLLGLHLLLLLPSIYGQSVPGLHASEKPKAATEESVQVRAARGEAPLSKLYSHLTVDPTRIARLPAPAAGEKQKESSEKKLRIGVVRSLDRPLNPLTDGPLYRVSEGDVRVLGVVSAGALFTRVHFTEMSLPTGARVFVYSMKNPDDFYGPYEGHGPSEDGTFWTPPMQGDGVVIEYVTPNSLTVPGVVPFRVSEISHIYKDLTATDAAGLCNLEVTAAWANVAKSVGMLQFVSGGGVFLCSGTLLNDQASDQTPYLLTANHCFNTQTEAQTLRVYWNYNSGDSPPGGTPFTDGANLLVTGTSSDFTFVRLTGSVPGGLFFSGWSANPVPLSTSVTGIHHPEGSHKRISFGATNSNCLSGLPGPCANFTHVGWNSGVTEPGSSGSGIWIGPAANPQFVGTLTGGLSSCSNPMGNDEYGSFSATYPSVSSFLSETDCVSALIPTTRSFTAAGGSGTVTVDAPGGCSWNASTTASFITINSGASGNGNGTVNYSVTSNSGAQRSGSIIVGQKVSTVTQSAGGSCAPTPIALGQTINGSLSTGDCPLGDGSFYDPYSFNGSAGQQISVSMSSAFDTYLFLLRPDGSILATDDDGGGGTNSRIPPGGGTITLPTTGTYVIYANSFSPGVTGPYSLTLNGTPAPTPVVQLNAVAYPVTEGTPGVSITVTRSGNTAGSSKVGYATSDNSGANNCNVNGGVASSRCDYETTAGTLTFAAGETAKTITIPIVNDSYAEINEGLTFTLSSPVGATLGGQSSATITITDNETTNGPNPIDTSSFFVRQHYIDFLNREPDVSGLAFWTGEIENCTPKPQCTEIKRINVSAAFFLSIEFQETGYLVYRMYKSSYGNIAGTPVPLTLNEFLPDTQQIGQGVVVGVGNWQTQLENNKVAFAQDFVSRSRFVSAYATTLTPAQFVDALFTNAGVTPSATDRNAAISEFGGAGNTTDTAARGRALRRVAENSILKQQEINRAFVLMQYFGYLRRNPNDAPEQGLNFDGYNFWLGKLNEFNGNFVNAEMVKAFLVSSEYRQRFGP